MGHFAILDCNNFYASCERLFNPSLEGKAVIVLSNNDGCVIARSQEAKQLKIQMGTPYFKIKDFCSYHKVKVFSSNYRLYGDLSRRVMDILMDMGLEVEVYSIDEAFLQFPNTMLAEAIEGACIALRQKVKKWVGIPTAVGIAPTKTLAKLANDKAKKSPQGVFSLCDPVLRQTILETSPVEDVWGIGSNSKIKLNRKGIYTAKEFCDQDPLFIRKLMGIVGERMLWELRGLSCLPLNNEPVPKQSITCSRSFGKKITALEELSEALSTFVNTACIKLRQQGSFAQGLCIFLESAIDPKTSRGRYYSHGGKLPYATQDTGMVIAQAKHYLRQIYQTKEVYRKCGVILLDLISADQIAPDLFESSFKRTQLMDTMDEINAQYGKEAVFFAAMGTQREWKARSDNSSKYCTTSWQGLPIVKAGLFYQIIL
jgi:DNA polymerase V